MCIYCTTTKYRKIYENHVGPIPKDQDGRSYEIHHIDNNHLNNKPENLRAVTLQEHYDIHYNQGDWGACLIMSERMKISPEEKSKLASLSNRKRIENGTHPFLSGLQKEKVKNGTHHWVGDAGRQRIEQQIASGTHPGTKVFAKIHTCPHCGKEGKGAVMYKHHYDNCKILQESAI